MLLPGRKAESSLHPPSPDFVATSPFWAKRGEKKQNPFFATFFFWANFGWAQNLPDNFELVSKTALP